MYTGNREKGASAVEFALVLPVLMLVLFGIIEFGLTLYDKAIITNASREGARRGIVYVGDTVGVSPGVVTSTVDSYVGSYLVSLGSGTGTPSTTITGNCGVPGSSLTVAVSYPYSFLVLPSFASGLAGGITLSGVTVMRCENNGL